MTPEAQNIAIAEACGWVVAFGKIYRTCETPGGEPDLSPVGDLPDYVNDLNAIHAAETILTGEEWQRYETDLWSVVAPDAVRQSSMPNRFSKAFLHASAAQRSDAFQKTKTIGRWK